MFFAGVLFSISLAIQGCKKDDDGLSLKTFEQMAKSFATTAALPVSLTSIRLDVPIPQDSLRHYARQIIEEMVFLRTDASGNIQVNRLKDDNLPASVLDGYVDGFLADNLLLSGDYLVRFEWKTTSGISFTTLGTVSAAGTPRFEPILFFNGIDNLKSSAATSRGQWTWGPWTRTIENGFGMTCVEVEWTVKMVTSPDGCNIVDPPPHVEITKQLSNCWLWEQRTTQGEAAWCNPYPDCNCSVQPNTIGEDCIKWVVVTYVATGTSNIEVEAGVSGEYKGITVDAKVSFDAGRCGSEATFETIRSICAKSGAK